MMRSPAPLGPQAVCLFSCPARAQNPPAVIAPTATWKVLPLATDTGCPFQLPYQTRIGTLSVISSDTIDQAPPDQFVQEIAVNGMATSLPELDAVAVPENAVPPAV